MGLISYIIISNFINVIKPSHPILSPSDNLCRFLTEKIGLSERSMDLGIRHSIIENAPLPIVLKSFGLISLSQYALILKWQEEND